MPSRKASCEMRPSSDRGAIMRARHGGADSGHAPAHDARVGFEARRATTGAAPRALSSAVGFDLSLIPIFPP